MAVATLPSLPPTTAADQAGPPPAGTDAGAASGENGAGAFTRVLGALADGSPDAMADQAQDGLTSSASGNAAQQGAEHLLDPLLAAQMAEMWGLGMPAMPAATDLAATADSALAQPFVLLFQPGGAGLDGSAEPTGDSGSAGGTEPTSAIGSTMPLAWPYTDDAIAAGTSATDSATLDPLRVIAAYTAMPIPATDLPDTTPLAAASPVEPFPTPADSLDTPASFLALGQVLPALLTARQAAATATETKTSATASTALPAGLPPLASDVPVTATPGADDGATIAPSMTATAVLPTAAKRPGRLPEAAVPSVADDGAASAATAPSLVADEDATASAGLMPEHRAASDASDASVPAAASSTAAPPAPSADPASSAAASLHRFAPDAGAIASAPGAALGAAEPSAAATATAGATATTAPATASTAAATPPPAPPAPPAGGANPMEKAIVHQVSRQLVRTDANGDRSLVIRLTPPELGTVRIELREHDGVLTAHLRAEDEAVGRAIDRLLPQLRSDLRGSDSAVAEVVRDRGQGQDGADERRGSSADQQAPWQRQRERDDNRSDRQRDGAPAFSLDLPRDADAAVPAIPRPTPIRRVDAAGVDALA